MGAKGEAAEAEAAKAKAAAKAEAEAKLNISELTSSLQSLGAFEQNALEEQIVITGNYKDHFRCEGKVDLEPKLKKVASELKKVEEEVASELKRGGLAWHGAASYMRAFWQNEHFLDAVALNPDLLCRQNSDMVNFAVSGLKMLDLSYLVSASPNWSNRPSVSSVSGGESPEFTGIGKINKIDEKDTDEKDNGVNRKPYDTERLQRIIPKFIKAIENIESHFNLERTFKPLKDFETLQREVHEKIEKFDENVIASLVAVWTGASTLRAMITQTKGVITACSINLVEDNASKWLKYPLVSHVFDEKHFLAFLWSQIKEVNSTFLNLTFLNPTDEISKTLLHARYCQMARAIEITVTDMAKGEAAEAEAAKANAAAEAKLEHQ